MTSIDLTGKTAFITGSTRGIGHAIARTLHAAGAKVAVVGRDRTRAVAVAAELGDRATQRFAVRDIAGETLRALTETRRDGSRRLGRPANDRHIRPGRVQRVGNAAADATRAASNECSPSGKVDRDSHDATNISS